MDSKNTKTLWIENFIAFSKHTIVPVLGIELIDIDDEHIELQMPITDAARQPFGALHGGVSMVLAETAASVHAAWGVDLEIKTPVGIEINGSHLRPALDGRVRAVAKVVQRSRSLIVHTVEIVHMETDKLLSTARVTNYYKRVRTDGKG